MSESADESTQSIVEDGLSLAHLPPRVKGLDQSVPSDRAYSLRTGEIADRCDVRTPRYWTLAARVADAMGPCAKVRVAAKDCRRGVL